MALFSGGGAISGDRSVSNLKWVGQLYALLVQFSDFIHIFTFQNYIASKGEIRPNFEIFDSPCKIGESG